MRLVCKYGIQKTMFDPSKLILPEHINNQWYIDRAEQEIIELISRLLVQEPLKVCSKVWPTNSHDTSTRKNSSQFEIAGFKARERQRQRRCQYVENEEEVLDISKVQSTQRQEKSQGREKSQRWEKSQKQEKSQRREKSQERKKSQEREKNQEQDRSQEQEESREQEQEQMQG